VILNAGSVSRPSRVNLNAKSGGKRAAFRLTAWLSVRVSTPLDARKIGREDQAVSAHRDDDPKPRTRRTSSCDEETPRRAARAELVSGSVIVAVRGHRLILAADLRASTAWKPGRSNQAVKRNAARFPPDFAFR